MPLPVELESGEFVGFHHELCLSRGQSRAAAPSVPGREWRAQLGAVMPAQTSFHVVVGAVGSGEISVVIAGTLSVT